MQPKDHHARRITLLRNTLNGIGETPSLKECKAMVDLFYSGHTDPQRCYYRVTIGEHAITTQEKLGMQSTSIAEMKAAEQKFATGPIVSTPESTTIVPVHDDNVPHYCNMPSLTQPQHLFAYLLDQIEHNSVYSDKVSFKLSKEDINLLAKQVKVFMEDEDSIGGGRRLKGIEKKAALVKMFNTQIGRRERACNIFNKPAEMTILEDKYKISAK
jgi:hypothetical protein